MSHSPSPMLFYLAVIKPDLCSTYKHLNEATRETPAAVWWIDLFVCSFVFCGRSSSWRSQPESNPLPPAGCSHSNHCIVTACSFLLLLSPHPSACVPARLALPLLSCCGSWGIPATSWPPPGTLLFHILPAARLSPLFSQGDIPRVPPRLT